MQKLDTRVKLGKNVTIEQFAVVKGNCVIGDNVTIGSGSVVIDSNVGSNSVVLNSRVVDSEIGSNCNVGPYAHLRNGTVVSDNCRIGNFVEIKNSSLGNGTKASHLAYIGDATVGSNCNVGCGVIFVNYDGKVKHHSTVGDNCFIGCNSTLIAPLAVGDDVFIACDSTVNCDLPSGSFGIGRSNITIKQNYAYRYMKGK